MCLKRYAMPLPGSQSRLKILREPAFEIYLLLNISLNLLSKFGTGIKFF